MEINIGTVLTVLVIIFAVNVTCVATGVYPLDKATNNAIMSGSDYQDINSTYNSNSLDYNTVSYTGSDTSAASSTDFITAGINFIQSLFTYILTFLSLLGGILFGYRFVFISLGLPTLMVWLFTGIVAFVQAMCLLYLYSYVSSILRGGSII